jgi:formylglycine-generating enzyme required for sulfatase activity
MPRQSAPIYWKRHASPAAPFDLIGHERVLRGSAFSYNLKDTRFTYRFLSAPDDTEGTVGFRCVSNFPAPAKQ